jgi:methionine synthase II (cobalamin-independent)
MGGMIWDRERSSAVYPTPNDLIEDLAALQIDEIGGLVRARGVRWVQLDSLSYNQVIDPGATGSARVAVSPEQALDAAIGVDAVIVTAVKREHPDLTVGMHICRGNYRSSWMAQGGYEPVAERLFNEVTEQLALSPQCGFASGSLGNLITVDDERRKLDLVTSVARQVWG